MNPVLIAIILFIAGACYFALSFLFEKIGKMGFNIYTKIKRNMGNELPKDEKDGEKNEL